METHDRWLDPEFSEPKIIVWDGDNTLWTWIEYAARAYPQMAVDISRETGKNLVEVQEKMREFYTLAGTMENEMLIQWLTDEGYFDDVPNFNEEELIKKIQQRFSRIRKNHFRLYPKIKEIVKKIDEKGIQNILLSDAPENQAEARLKSYGLYRYFSQMNTMPPAVARRLPKKFRLNGKKKNEEENYPLVKKTQVDRVKPFTNLEEILQMTKDQIRRFAIFIDDNDQKGIELARMIGARGIHAKYGIPKKELSEKLTLVGGHKAPLANASKPVASPYSNDTDGLIKSAPSTEDIERILNI